MVGRLPLRARPCVPSPPCSSRAWPLLLTLLPFAAPAGAATTPQHPTAKHQKQQAEHRKKLHKKKQHKKKQHPKPKPKPKKPKAPPKPPGQPPRSYVVPATSYFSYPNLSKSERLAIRNRVLKTINSTWGGRRTSIGTPRPENGSIRIATWSFDDWDVAHALVAARKRGVSVQIVAAKTRNSTHPAWRWLRKRLGQKLYRPGYPLSRDTASFARVVPRSLPRAGRHPAREVLPVQGRRRRSRPGDHLPDLDEPDLHGLRRVSGTRRRSPTPPTCTPTS